MAESGANGNPLVIFKTNKNYEILLKFINTFSRPKIEKYYEVRIKNKYPPPFVTFFVN